MEIPERGRCRHQRVHPGAGSGAGPEHARDEDGGTSRGIVQTARLAFASQRRRVTAAPAFTTTVTMTGAPAKLNVLNLLVMSFFFF